MAPTRTKDWRTTSASRQGRFNRSATRPQAGRRFTRSTPQTAQPPRSFGRSSGRSGAGGAGRTRRRQPQPSGAQGLLQSIKGSLPGGSSGKRGRRNSSAGVGGLLSSLGGKKSGGARKPAMLGLLGAGAAGAAAVVAKRRRGADSSDTPTTPQHISADSQGGPATQVDEPPAPRMEPPAKGDEVV